MLLQAACGCGKCGDDGACEGAWVTEPTMPNDEGRVQSAEMPNTECRGAGDAECRVAEGREQSAGMTGATPVLLMRDDDGDGNGNGEADGDADDGAAASDARWRWQRH